jgi:hypothetical protein
LKEAGCSPQNPPWLFSAPSALSAVKALGSLGALCVSAVVGR